MNSLTVNLHLMLASFYRPRGSARRILIEAGAFSSDRHAVASQIAWHGLDPETELIELAPPRGRGAAARGAHRGVPGAPGRGDRAGAVARGAVSHRPGVRPRPHRARRAPSRLHRRIRPGALDRQHAARAARGGRRFRRLVQLQVSERRPRRDRRLLRARAPQRAQSRTRHGGALPGARLAGWWGHEADDALPDGAAVSRRRRRRRLADQQSADSGGCAARSPRSRMFIEAGAGAAARRSPWRSPTVSTSCCGRSRPRCSILTPARPRAAAAASCRCASPAAAARGSGVFDGLSARGVVCDWRSPGHHPRRARAALQPLRGRLALRAER